MPLRLVFMGTPEFAVPAIQLLVNNKFEIFNVGYDNQKVIELAKKLDIICFPGVSTPTEALSALNAGADGLKIFPAEMITPKILKSWKVILPDNTMLFPVGGIKPESLESYFLAGATGFGIGSALYHPGKSVLEIVKTGKAFKKVWDKLN